MKFKITNPKPIFTVLILILCFLGFIYYSFVFHTSYASEKFADHMIQIAEQNEKPIFKIQKVILYSSANAIDKTNTQALKDLSICQYTDIAIFIDNTSTIYDITNENTVKKLYIDNIQIHSNSDKGTKYINYKNALDFAKYKEIEQPSSDKIEFNIINTNSENENNDYSKPTFYTDCSNPITIEYMNKDIITNYAVTDNSNVVSFNGKVLQEANIPIEDINYTLSFNINIINNLNEQFVYNMKFDVNLNDTDGGIYKGYKYDNNSTSGSEYNFFKIVKNK